MADLKTTNIYGDAYINNKVGIATNAPATRLQIGQLLPTAATEGIQFGDDTGARIYRDSSTVIKVSGGFQSTSYIYAGNYLQTAGNLIYPASQTATQRLEVGNASGNAWIDGLTIAQGGNVTVYNNLTVNNAATVTNDLTVNGNTYLGNANNDTVYVNDTIRIGATDSGDASLFFGEGAVAGSDYGARWYWDSGYTFTWYTRNAGTDTALFDYVTNDLNYINWRRHFHMQNREINYNAQIHFNAGTRFVGQDTSILLFRSDSTSSGGIRVQNGSIATKGYTGYWDAGGGGILNDTGNWAVRYNFGSANSGGTLYGAWTVNGNISATNLSGTNTGDQSIGNGTITIAAGTGVGVGSSNTFTTNQSGATTVTITNTGVTALTTNTGLSTNASATGAVTITNTGVTNISAGTGIGTSASTGAVTITNNGVTSNVAGTGISVSGATGAVTITNGGVTSLAGTTNRVTVSAATGAVTLNLPQDIHTSASPTFSGLSLTSVSTTGATITNLTGAYQNTTVYDSPRTQSATPSRGIRAPASSIQFTDSYAIAPFYTYRSTGDWPVPYGIGWGTGGESSGIFQRYASNGSSFGDMIFYTGNDGSGAFSFRRHTWEGNAYFAAGSGELNTELFRVDWSGNLTMLGTLNGSANSATLYANNGSYGSWKIGGTRNGWYGIEFESGTNLMANSNEVGFHRNGHGWQLRWYAGVGYVSKGNPGGGTEATILDSSNFSSYALPINPDGDGVCVTYSDENPTFNGVGVGGGWYFGADGSTTGGGLTAKILNAFGGGVNSTNGYYVGNNNFLANSSTTTTTLCIDGSNNHFANELTISGVGMGAYNLMKYSGLRSGDWQTFTNTEGQLNVIQVNNISSGAHTNYPTGVYGYGAVMSWRTTNHSFQLYAAHTGDLAYKTQWGNDNYSGWRRILDSTNYPHAANMNQYVRTTDTCSFAALTVSNTINGSVTGNAGTVTNGVYLSGGTQGITGIKHFTSNLGTTSGNLSDPPLQVFASGTNSAFMSFHRGGSFAVNMGLDSDNVLRIGGWSAATNRLQLDMSGNLTLAGVVDATQFRDSADTAYFVDPAGTSNLNQWTTLTAARLGRSRYWTNRVAYTADANYHTGTNGWTTDEGTWANAWKGGFSGWDIWGSSTDHPQGAGYVHAQGIVSGQHLSTTNGSSAYGWMMVGSHAATDNRYWLRGKWSTTTSGWVEMLTSGNYNSFSPTLTGTGASGTWSINVTGNASGTAGSISGFNNPAVAATANTIVYRDGSGHIYGGYILGSYFNASAGNSENPTIGQIWTQNTTDNYLRKSTPAHFRSQVTDGSYPSLTGANASGTWSINITGNAGTATSATSATSAVSATYLNSSNYIARCGSSGNANTDFNNTPAGTIRHNGDDSNLTNSPGATWWFYDNYRHSNSSNYWGIQVAWGWEDNANRLATRNVTGGSFGGWVYYLNSANYNSYSPTLTGTGASGTWAINITGNAATATTATNVTIANGSVTLAKIENITAYTILGNSNASAVATPAALSVATVATMLSGQTMNINGSSTSCSGNAASATLATKASTLSQGGGNGTGMTFNWSGQSGQPTWLWGSNDGSNIYVWNPSNFNVNYATSAGSATSATNATTAGGLAVQSGTNYDANKIVRTDGNGYVNFGWINTISGDNGTTAIDRVYASSDGYIRYYTPANFRTVLDVPTRNGSGVTNFGINTAPSNRLHINGDGSNPTIRIDNTAFGSGTSSSRGFFGWLPISISGNTRYIQLYS